MSLPLPAEDPAGDHTDVPAWPASETRELRDAVDGPVLRASGPGEMVQLLPYVLGFHPEDSLVLVALRGLRIVASARNDLVAPLTLLEPWCTSVARAGADRVVGVLYLSDVTGWPLPKGDYAEEVRGMVTASGLDLIDLLAVGKGRWWSYQCSDDACCPSAGTPIESEGALAAAAVVEGMVALPDREDLRRELEIDQQAVALVQAEIDRIEPAGDDVDGRAAAWSTVRRFVRRARSRPTITPGLAAPVILALQDKHVRDAAMGFLVGPPDPKVGEAWRRLTTMSPPELRAAPAVLYALWCYAGGSGARANMGIDVALAADPGYTMAHLLLELQMAPMNPFEVISDLATEAARVGRRIQRRSHPRGRHSGRSG